MVVRLRILLNHTQPEQAFFGVLAEYTELYSAKDDNLL